MSWQVFEKVYRCESCGHAERTGERQVAGRRSGDPSGPVAILKRTLQFQPHPCPSCGQATEQAWLAKSGAVVTGDEASDLARKASSDDPEALEVIAREKP